VKTRDKIILPFILTFSKPVK